MSKKGYLVSSGPARAKAGLVWRKEFLRLEKIRETSKHKTLKEFGYARGERDRTKGRGSVCGFARFVHRVNGRGLPTRGKGVSGPGEVEDEKKKGQNIRGKMLEERVRDAIRTSCTRGGKTRDGCCKLRERERRAEGGVFCRHTRGRAELTKIAAFVMAAGFKRGPREVRFEIRRVTSGQILICDAPGKGWISGRERRDTRNRAKKGEDLTGLRSWTQRGCCSLPRLSLSFGNGCGSSAGGREVGLTVLFTEMSLAIRLSACLHKFSQLRGPPSLRRLAGTAKRNGRLRRLEHYRREEFSGFGDGQRRVRVRVRTKRRDSRAENTPVSFIKVKSWTTLIGGERAS